MIAKIAIFLAVVAIAQCGVIAPVVTGLAHSPASTVKLANVAPVVTYAAAPAIHHGAIAYNAAPAIHHGAIAYNAGPAVVAAAPQVVAAPAAVAYSTGVVAGPAVIPQAVSYAAPAKVVQTFEPVEQHGYQIAY